MSGLKYCRICLDVDVRMFQISGSEVQDVYEKLTNKKVQEDGTLYYACFVCHRHLQNCHQLVVKSQKWDELSKELLISSELDPEPIPNVTRLKYGLVHSLMNSDKESFQILEGNEIIQTEDKSECEADGVVVKHDDDGAPRATKKNPDLDEKYIPKQDEAYSVGSGTKENMSDIETNTVANEANSSQIACDGKSEQLAENDPKYFVCNVCGNIYDTKTSLIRHINRHKATVIKPIVHREINYNMFQCQDCSYLCNDNDSFIEHRWISHGKGKLYKCKYCDYTSINNGYVKLHIKTHTEENLFECKYCNYTSKSNGTLKLHVKTHTGQKPYKCKYCNYSYIRNSYLKLHLRNHTGENPFQCYYCNYKCTTKAILNLHIRTHTVEKPFKCQHCDFKSATSYSLKMHVRTHTEKTLYKYQYCPEISILNKHVKK